MRGLGVPIAVLVLAAGCKFGGPPLTGDDGPVGDDAAVIDAPDAPDIDGPPSPARKKVITVDHTKVTGDQVAFPVWISLTATDLAARASTDGSDIHFTRPGGAALEHEIQYWSKATGRLEAWVRVDLADTAPTLIELRYGDPASVHAQNPSLVFSSSFAAVWHLDDSLMNTTVVDATGARNGTAMGLNAGDQAPAQLGGGIGFGGNNDQITFTNPYAGNGPHTISAWVNQQTPAGACDSIATVGNPTGSQDGNPVSQQSRWFHSYHQANGQGCVGFYANDWFDPTNMNLNNAGWVLVHWTFQGGQSRLYRNGQQVDMHTHDQGINTQGTAGYLGYAPPGWGDCALNGALDEVRLATVRRDTSWIATEYANQSSPQTFYSVGPEEMVTP